MPIIQESKHEDDVRGGHRRCRDDVWSWIGKRSSQRQCRRSSFAFRTIVNGTDRRLRSPSLSSSPLLVEPPRPSLQVVLVEIKVRRGGRRTSFYP